MICPGSPYPAHLPRHRPPDSPRSQRSQRSLGSLPSSRTSSGSRSTVITYRSETTSSLGLFGKKTKDSFTCQFERSVSHISNTLSYYPSLCWSSPSVVIMSGMLVTSNVSDSLQSEWWYLISRKTNEIVCNTCHLLQRTKENLELSGLLFDYLVLLIPKWCHSVAACPQAHTLIDLLTESAFQQVHLFIQLIISNTKWTDASSGIEDQLFVDVDPQTKFGVC